MKKIIFILTTTLLYQGGKMMFNFADKDYSWEEFIEDKKYMFNYINGN